MITPATKTTCSTAMTSPGQEGHITTSRYVVHRRFCHTVFSKLSPRTSFNDFVYASRLVRVNAPQVVGNTVAGGIATMAVGWVKTVARVVSVLTVFFLARHVEMVMHVMQMIDNKRWNETHATAEKEREASSSHLVRTHA